VPKFDTGQSRKCRIAVVVARFGFTEALYAQWRQLDDAGYGRVYPFASNIGTQPSRADNLAALLLERAGPDDDVAVAGCGPLAHRHQSAAARQLAVQRFNTSAGMLHGARKRWRSSASRWRPRCRQPATRYSLSTGTLGAEGSVERAYTLAHDPSEGLSLKGMPHPEIHRAVARTAINRIAYGKKAAGIERGLRHAVAHLAIRRVKVATT